MTNQLPNKEKPEEDATTLKPEKKDMPTQDFKPEYKTAPLQGPPDNTSEAPEFRAAVGMSRRKGTPRGLPHKKDIKLPTGI